MRSSNAGNTFVPKTNQILRSHTTTFKVVARYDIAIFRTGKIHKYVRNPFFRQQSHISQHFPLFARSIRQNDSFDILAVHKFDILGFTRRLIVGIVEKQTPTSIAACALNAFRKGGVKVVGDVRND